MRDMRIRRPAGAIRALVKRTLGHLPRASAVMKRPILISSTRRSGSTLLLEMVCTQPGVTYSDQPLDPWGYNAHRSRLPVMPYGVFAGNDPAEVDAVLDYLEDIGHMRLRRRTQWRIYSPEFKWVVDRIAIKELNAKAILPAIAERDAFDIVFLLRHPVPTALSILARGWASTAPAYLKSEWFREEVLGAERARACDDVWQTAEPLGRFVLEWGLDNYVPLHTPGSWLTLTYEELVAQPDAMSSLLATRLGLSDAASMAEDARTPSRTALRGSAVDVKRRGAAARVDDWTARVRKEDAIRAMHVVTDVLGIDAYEAGSPEPNSRYRVLDPSNARW